MARKATFFTSGLDRGAPPGTDPARIVADGHELASHGYEHIRVDTQTPAQFRADVRSGPKRFWKTRPVSRVQGYPRRHVLFHRPQ